MTHFTIKPFLWGCVMTLYLPLVGLEFSWPIAGVWIVGALTSATLNALIPTE
jgi:hypothetical protein